MTTISLSLVILISTYGCGWVKAPSWRPFKKSQSVAPVEEVAVPQAAKVQIPLKQGMAQGRVIQPERLSKGGRILLVPFRAGESVVASEELDKIAYRVMQGINNSLAENPPYFDIMINDETELPDYYINGYFTRKRESPGFIKALRLRQGFILGVEGKLVDANTQEVLATFSDEVSSSDPGEDFIHLGFQLGNNIGEFLHRNINASSE